MTSEAALTLTTLIFAAALLYSAVGFAGGSGYLAAMALFGVAPLVMRPTALTLNIFVAAVATARYYRAGAFSWSVFWPFAAASVPFAFIGGSLTLPGAVYRPVVGAILVYAAWLCLRRSTAAAEPETRKPRPGVVAVAGAAIGFLAGLTGVGGGIFLSPLIILAAWAEVRVVSGIAAAFILVNSAAGLLGMLSRSMALPTQLPLWAAAAVVGGLLGSELGSRYLSSKTIQRLLAVILAVAGLRMALSIP
ncbi:MAG: sulfite exporter TauE/SafE family protein [Gemmatimonadota bacterium]|nr:MAG: sulfite exporter TauE/SafE family protein [Gemmatimonadota bacterium]